MKDDNGIWILTFHYYDGCDGKDSVFVSRKKSTAIEKAVDSVVGTCALRGDKDEDATRKRIAGILDRTGLYDDGIGTEYYLEKSRLM